MALKYKHNAELTHDALGIKEKEWKKAVNRGAQLIKKVILGKDASRMVEAFFKLDEAAQAAYLVGSMTAFMQSYKMRAIAAKMGETMLGIGPSGGDVEMGMIQVDKSTGKVV